MLSSRIKEIAAELGFDACYFYKPQERPQWKEALENFDACDMDYLKNNIDTRANPRLLWEPVKTIVVLAYNYFMPKQSQGFALYAYGDDYHIYIKKMLKNMGEKIGCGYRCFVDTAPLMEKQIAIESGLGWQGKNTLVINPDLGSAFFLGFLFLDVEVDFVPQPVLESLCGNCNLCQKACPLGALDVDYKLNVEKCRSYISIEKKDKNYCGAYGCDDCLYACPYNQKAALSKINKNSYIDMKEEELASLSKEDFETLFSGTAIKRIGYEGFIKLFRKS